MCGNAAVVCAYTFFGTAPTAAANWLVRRQHRGWIENLRKCKPNRHVAQEVFCAWVGIGGGRYDLRQRRVLAMASRIGASLPTCGRVTVSTAGGAHSLAPNISGTNRKTIAIRHCEIKCSGYELNRFRLNY